MIEIVIKITEEDYERVKKKFQMSMNIMANAIAHGKPLPKGHDRLIEAKRLKEVFRRNTGYDYHDLIDIAPTIIEAEGSDSE